MIKRIGFFAYGVTCYLIFLATFLYAIAFVGGFAVPRTLDGTRQVPLGTGLAIDAALLAIFAMQHSLMARKWFKDRWTRIVPKVVERSTYVLASSLALILLFVQWRPLGGLVWSVDSPAARAVLLTLFGFGWALVLVATFLINHFDLFGLRQVWLSLRGRPYTQLTFGTPGPYRLVRHPLYAGFILAFWMTPTMTYAHLLFAVATTAYILIAIQFEERDLLREHPDTYEAYRRRVPMLVPFLRLTPKQKLARAGTLASLFFLLKGIVWLGVAGAAMWLR
jgi:methanethiol S-methyltransferase